MANIRTGTFLRLIGMDLVKRKGAFEVEIKPIALPGGYSAAYDALGALQYGAAMLSNMAYVGYEAVIGQDLGADVSASQGDTTKYWQTAYTSGGRLPDKVNIPGRDTVDPSLTLPGSENKINTGAAPWVAFEAAMQDANLLAPYNGSTFKPFLGGVSNVSQRKRPKEVVREVPSPIVIGGTRLKLFGLDVRGVVAASEFFVKPVTIASGIVTAINALGNAIYGSVPITGPLPSLMTYVGWEVAISLDNGYTGGGAGDSRAKWRVVSNAAGTSDMRFTIPGRNDSVGALFQTGSYTLADWTATAWANWIAGMTGIDILAPQTEAGTQATLIGALAANRFGGTPRENVS